MGGGGGREGESGKAMKRKKTETEIPCCGVVCRGEFLTQF